MDIEEIERYRGDIFANDRIAGLEAEVIELKEIKTFLEKKLQESRELLRQFQCAEVSTRTNIYGGEVGNDI